MYIGVKDFLQGNVTEYVVHGHGSDGARIVGRSSSRKNLAGTNQ